MLTPDWFTLLLSYVSLEVLKLQTALSHFGLTNGIEIKVR